MLFSYLLASYAQDFARSSNIFKQHSEILNSDIIHIRPGKINLQFIVTARMEF